MPMSSAMPRVMATESHKPSFEATTCEEVAKICLCFFFVKYLGQARLGGVFAGILSA